MPKIKKPLFSIPSHLVGPPLDKYILRSYNFIIGVDEVGRGSLAGPVVSCALLLKKEGLSIKGLNDSKLLSLKKREALFAEIITKTHSFNVGVAFPSEIEAINILEATKLSMYRAIQGLPQHVFTNTLLLVDGLFLPYTGLESFKLIKGDQKSPSIMAASIVAKVTRDKMMSLYEKVYPGFELGKNKGYGTKKHKSKLSINSYTPIHRKSFHPLKDFF